MDDRHERQFFPRHFSGSGCCTRFLERSELKFVEIAMGGMEHVSTISMVRTKSRGLGKFSRCRRVAREKWL